MDSVIRGQLLCNGDGTYTLPAYLRGYHAYKKNWTPILGDNSLVCIRDVNSEYDDTSVDIMYGDRKAGYVPKHLAYLFSPFLFYNGTITAQVAGAAIDRGVGLEVPVDYILKGDIKCIQLILEMTSL